MDEEITIRKVDFYGENFISHIGLRCMFPRREDYDEVIRIISNESHPNRPKKLFLISGNIPGVIPLPIAKRLDLIFSFSISKDCGTASFEFKSKNIFFRSKVVTTLSILYFL